MSGIGDRLREERDRLGLSQAAFGEIGGVKANAQGNYEKGERFPDAGYLAAVSAVGVDVLYVVTGERKPQPANCLSDLEAQVVAGLRVMAEESAESVFRITRALAGQAGPVTEK